VVGALRLETKVELGLAAVQVGIVN